MWILIAEISKFSDQVKGPHSAGNTELQLLKFILELNNYLLNLFQEGFTSCTTSQNFKNSFSAQFQLFALLELITFFFDSDEEREVLFEEFHRYAELFIFQIIRKFDVLIVFADFTDDIQRPQSLLQFISIQAKIIEVGMEK